MKLIYAGTNGPHSEHGNFLFNCTRNAACQSPFFVPIRQVNELIFYADLPGKPATVDGASVDLCGATVVPGEPEDFNGDFGNDFNIGSEPTIINPVYTVVFNKYVVGQKPDGTWYGVFGNPTFLLPPGTELRCFFLRFVFTVGGIEHVYYSEQICLPLCDNLTLIKGCYPNEPIGSSATDCNGIYYGFPAGDSLPLGDANYRYIHTAYVRDAAIIEQKNKLSFTAFNSRRVYKQNLNRQYLFESELVPTFYKDVIIGVLSRGNVYIQGKEWTLAADQDFSIIDTDSKLWRLDVLLESDCNSSYGCKPSDCELPVPGCDNPPTGFVVAYNAELTQWQYTFTGGVLLPGDMVEWEVVEKDTNMLIDTGLSSGSFIIDGTIHQDYDPATVCYLVRWRKLCPTGPSDWQQATTGFCPVPFQCQGLQASQKPFIAVGWAPDENIIFNFPECGGQQIQIEWKQRGATLCFFTDATLSTPLNVTLVNFVVNVGGNPVVLNGTANAFYLGFFSYEMQQLDQECNIDTQQYAIPHVTPSECFTTGPEVTPEIGPGKLRIERGPNPTLPSGYTLDGCVVISGGACGPNTLDAMETFEELTLGVFRGKVQYNFASSATGVTVESGTLTITDGMETEVIDFSITPVIVTQWYQSTKDFYMDQNRTITMTYAE